MSDAIVVGSGPNGLACAAVLARAGVNVTVLEAEETIGGGTRTTDGPFPGLLHDDCSAVHPMAVGSPAFKSMELDRHGLEWCYPEVDLAHPLDDGSAGVMVRDVARTAEGLGADGPAWRRVFGPPAASFDALADDIFAPILHVPRHPIKLTRFGIPAALPATVLARAWRTPQARALFGGVAAHAFAPLTGLMSSSVGAALITACHAWGWPVARGGSRAITDALASVVTAHGGTIETGRRVTEMPSADVVVFDLVPSAVADIAGERLPTRVARAYRRYKHGPGAFKLDLAVEGGVPWTNEPARRAGTVHLGGTFEEIVACERDVNAGRMPERPFILVGQQYLADPSRSSADVHPVWAYAHTPSGWPGDATELILDQIERFAPGLRERLVSHSTRSATEMPAYNSNYLGGDIIGGANTAFQVLFRPRLALDPYETRIPGAYICSASTPPGAGAHGMNGANAAASALRFLERG